VEQEWIRNCVEDDSAAITVLGELIESPTLSTQLASVAEIAPHLSTVLKKVESQNILSCEVWMLLQSTLTLLEGHNIDCTKLRGYMASKHPSHEFWRLVQDLDPKIGNPSHFELTIPRELSRFSRVPVPPLDVCFYKALLESRPRIDNVVTFWQNQAVNMPVLSSLTLNALTVPPSSSDVERSFSALKRILTPSRNCLTEENLGIHLRLVFNSRCELSEIDCFDDL